MFTPSLIVQQHLIRQGLESIFHSYYCSKVLLYMVHNSVRPGLALLGNALTPSGVSVVPHSITVTTSKCFHLNSAQTWNGSKQGEEKKDRTVLDERSVISKAQTRALLFSSLKRFAWNIVCRGFVRCCMEKSKNLFLLISAAEAVTGSCLINVQKCLVSLCVFCSLYLSVSRPLCVIAVWTSAVWIKVCSKEHRLL